MPKGWNQAIVQYHFRLPRRGGGRAAADDSIHYGCLPAIPGAEFWTNIFTPYPGSPIMDRAKELGIETPQSLEGWSDYFPRYTVLPWLQGRDHARLQTMRDYLRIAFDRQPISRYEPNPFIRKVQQTLSRPARWRLDHDFYDFPVELWLNRKLKKLIPVARPVVDAKMLKPALGTNCP